MPVKRSYVPVPVNVSDSGNLLPDLPAYRLNPSDYVTKLNWVRYNGSERKREGWDFPAPLPGWTADMLGSFDATSPCEAIKGIRRPNGTYAIVGCGGGKIKAFSYDANAWVVIGTGFSTDGTAGFRWWQIEDVAGYAVFNNGRDLICYWQVGDVSVTPIYEFREQGYAACGNITEYYGVLICSDILEIDATSMSGLMNGAKPYRTIDSTSGLTLSRVGFERVWSNFADPRDFAATVDGSMTGASNALTLAWPMASFKLNDIIVVEGAGTAGGNLTTTITSISGIHLTTADNAVATVTNTPVQKATALNSIVGGDELEGDGSTIIREMALKNQLISYKESGEIFQSYYTGNVSQPFASQRTSRTDRAIRFPRALVNVRDQYHLFPGANHFFKYLLSAQDPVQHDGFLGFEDAMFFTRVVGAPLYSVFAADNAAVGNIFFAYPMGQDEEEAGYAEYFARSAISFNYNEGQESLDEIDGFNFMCASTVNKPTAGFTCDKSEYWFLMGDVGGKITLYGRSNQNLFTMRRYGEAFVSRLKGGYFGLPGYTGFDYSKSEIFDKYVKRIILLLAGPESIGPITLSLYGSRATNAGPILLAQRTMVNPVFPVAWPVDFRRAYFQLQLETSIDSPVRYSGVNWIVSGQDIEQISQLKA